jgi:hypothetical protein
VCAGCNSRGPAFSFPGDRYAHPHNEGLPILTRADVLAMERA